MNKQRLLTDLEPILSRREIKVVLKRLNNRHITQTESNYLSRSIRPKLKSAEFAASIELLSLLDYRRRRYEREDGMLREEIMKAICNIIDDIRAIFIYGSYIRNSHTNYRDIDVMIVLKEKLWKTSAGRNKLQKDIERSIDMKTDVNLVVYRELTSLFPYSPLLQTELEDSEVIYGNVKLGKRIIINKKYLYRKLLESEYVIELGRTIDPKYIYNAIRNCLAIELFIKRRIDNILIIKTIEDNIGKKTADSLLDNKASPMQRDIALKYLKYLYDKVEKVLK